MGSTGATGLAGLVDLVAGFATDGVVVLDTTFSGGPLLALVLGPFAGDGWLVFLDATFFGAGFVTFLVTIFCAVTFFATTFLTATFFTAAFLVPPFFGATFFALATVLPIFLVVGFFGAAFLPAGLRATTFLAGVRFMATFFTVFLRLAPVFALEAFFNGALAFLVAPVFLVLASLPAGRRGVDLAGALAARAGLLFVAFPAFFKFFLAMVLFDGYG